jgi:hypothetical protein
MASTNDIVKQRQCAMRREMDRRGIALKAVSFDSGIPYSTLLSYFPQEGGQDPAMMSVAAQYALAENDALPADILSLLLPAGKLIVRVAENVDHDEADRACRDFSAAKAAAHHPESEAGREIGPNEDKALRAKLTLIQGSAAA